MTRRQLDCVLARNNVGRMAFVHAGRIELRPVHYVYARGALYGRTTFGTKALAWHDKPEVVLEIDEVEELFTWRSVVVRGSIALLKPRGTRADRAEYWDAVAVIRSLVPDALTERDPTPDRSFVFRVELGEVSGRQAGR